MSDISIAIDAALHKRPLEQRLGPVGQFVFEFLQGPMNAPMSWAFLAVTACLLVFVGVAHISIPGSMTVRSNPAGAEVVLDGMKEGVTPLKLKELRQGPHTLEVRMAGYDSKVVQFQIQPFAPRSRYVELEKAAPQMPVASNEGPKSLAAELFGRGKAVATAGPRRH